MFKLEIDTSNDDFKINHAFALARILREAAEALEESPDAMYEKAVLTDVNGNSVGRWDFEPD